MKGLHPSCQSSRIFLREHSGRDVRPSTFRVPRGRALCVLLLQLSRCSSWPGAVPALWPRQALPPRQRDGLRCFIGSATGAQPQRHGRRIFKKHVSGLDDFEKIPNLNWDKFDKGSTGAIAMDIRPGPWHIIDREGVESRGLGRGWQGGLLQLNVRRSEHTHGRGEVIQCMLVPVSSTASSAILR